MALVVFGEAELMPGVGTLTLDDVLRGSVADLCHLLLYARPGVHHLRWFGVPILKNPLDLFIYQEIITELAPALIVETGTAAGGSALYLASLCELLGQGEVISIDVGPGGKFRPAVTNAPPDFHRITYLTGSSVDPKIVASVHARVEAASGPVLAILDSDHTTAHVRAELEAYAPLVTPGSYVIVEDTNIGGHPVPSDGEGGPWDAVEGFLKDHPEYERDRAREKLLVTFNPGGYLRRVT